MIELRWVERDEDMGDGFGSTVRVLQYRVLFYPVMAASGDIVLQPYDSAKWMDVPEQPE